MVFTLCHLLGFQHIFEDDPNARSFIGFTGFDLISTGVVTIETFKQQHIKTKYKKIENVFYISHIYINYYRIQQQFYFLMKMQ